jgi:hypothetical protein
MDDDGSIERSVTARRDASMASADGDDASSTSPHREFGQPRAGSLGTVVGAFKSAVTRRINQHRGTPGASVWQRNYHDRIIRNERHLHARQSGEMARGPGAPRGMIRGRMRCLTALHAMRRFANEH